MSRLKLSRKRNSSYYNCKNVNLKTIARVEEINKASKRLTQYLVFKSSNNT